MSSGCGRFTYPLVMVTVVATTWCCAWARSVNDESDRGYWPAKDPELMRRVLTPDTTPDDDADAEIFAISTHSLAR